MKPLIALLIIAASSAIAADLTIGETTYREYTVTRVEPDGLTISHADGTAKIPFPHLPEALQKQHSYDPKRAATYAKKEAEIRTARLRTESITAEAKKAFEAMEKQGVEMRLKVNQVLENGILADVFIPDETGETSRRSAFIHGSFEAIDGQFLKATLYPAGRFSYGSVLGAKRTVLAFATDPASALKNYQK